MANSGVTEYTKIDEQFPVAGQDNDSQGFRDNFAAIKDDLQKTSSELTELRTKAIFKEKLNDDTALENDLQNSVVSNGVLESMSERVYNTGNIASDSDDNSIISWQNGSYQNVTLAASVTLKIQGWPPNGQYGKMRLAIRANGGIDRIAQFSAGAGTIRASERFLAARNNGDFIVTSATTPKIIDIWTSDAGGTIFIDYVGEFSIL